MTKEEFRIKFSQAVAEDDTELFELIKPELYLPYVELSNKGLDTLTNIAEVAAEPLFEEIEKLEIYLRESKELLIAANNEIDRLRQEIAKYGHKLQVEKGKLTYWEDKAISLYFNRDSIGEKIFRNILKTRDERIDELEKEVSSLQGKLSFYEE